jgi:LysM repeat protein
MMRLSTLFASVLLAATLHGVPSQDALERLNEEVRQQGEELSILKEKIQNQEYIISQLREEAKASASSKKQEERDVRLSQQVEELHKRLKNQEENSATLQKALSNIVEAVQDEPKSGNNKVYRVAAGDTLEKIASRQGTNPGAIKEMNHLKSDRIYVGQKLKMP